MTHSLNTADPKEAISALVDGQWDAAHYGLQITGAAAAVMEGGELARGTLAGLVQSVAQDDELRATWMGYHLIGEALRAQAGLGTVAIQSPAVAQALAPQRDATDAANDSVFRWKMVASVAAMAAVGALSWSIFGDKPSGNAVLAKAAQRANLAAAATPESPVMIRDPRLDALLEAHKQFGAASALQQPAGFLRNAAFESGQR